MYLTPAAAERLVRLVSSSLAADGWLAVAPAEASSQWFRPLAAVNFPGAIFFLKGGDESEPTASSWLTDPYPVDLPRAWPDVPIAETATRNPPEITVAAPSPSPPDDEAARQEDDLLARARSFADRGRLAEALDACERAMERHGLDAELHRLLAAIHQERGDLDAALVALRRALYLDPDCAESHLALGNLLTRRGDGRRGLLHFKAAHRLRSEAS
jgi:tetratricopeptide (TPR) repeat protein